MSSYHMTPDEFRAAGAELVEWIAQYMETVEGHRIVPDVKPGEIIARLPATAPEEPEPFASIVTDLNDIIMPGVTHWQSPGWFAYFPANTSGPGILGDLVSSGLGQQGMLWATSPAATELEMVVVDWLAELLDLPAAWRTAGPGGGVIQMSASDATHTALVVARHRILVDWGVREFGGVVCDLGPVLEHNCGHDQGMNCFPSCEWLRHASSAGSMTYSVILIISRFQFS